jgi:hypothetical protein
MKQAEKYQTKIRVTEKKIWIGLSRPYAEINDLTFSFLLVPIVTRSLKREVCDIIMKRAVRTKGKSLCKY